MMKKAVFLGLLCASLFAMDDSYENRSKEATRYLEVMSMKSTLMQAIEQGANSKAKTEADKKQLKEILQKYINADEIIAELKEVMIKHYSADELSAMSDFYSSPVGKSIIKKQNAANADMMVKMQAIVLKMMMKIMNDKSLQKDKGGVKKDASPTAI